MHTKVIKHIYPHRIPEQLPRCLKELVNLIDRHCLFRYENFIVFILPAPAAPSVLRIHSSTAMGTRHEGETAQEKETRRLRLLKEGEWACPDPKCAHVNPEFKNACETCGRQKPRSKNRVGKEIGKEMADKSKGLFAAEDWVCSKCGNVNWARRKTCNVCNAPKLADLEKRTVPISPSCGI
nr:Zinc finger domain containing protein [Haemonchus contortus]